MRQAILRSWSHPRVGLVCALVMLLTAGLAGCGSSSPTQPAAQRTMPAGEATATSTSEIVAPSITVPTSTTGWQTYTDSTYHFKTVIPPRWRLAAVLDTIRAPECEYDVVYFPPGDTRAMEHRVWVGMHEYMLITISLQCPSYDPAKDPNLAPISTVTISGVATTLYGQSDSQEVDRVAYAHFGGHPYTFGLTGQSNQGTATTADVPLYLRVLRDFVYQGSK